MQIVNRIYPATPTQLIAVVTTSNASTNGKNQSIDLQKQKSKTFSDRSNKTNSKPNFFFILSPILTCSIHPFEASVCSFTIIKIEIV